MLCGPVAMFLKVTTIVSPSSALSVGPSRPAEEEVRHQDTPEQGVRGPPTPVLQCCSLTVAANVNSGHMSQPGCPEA